MAQPTASRESPRKERSANLLMEYLQSLHQCPLHEQTFRDCLTSAIPPASGALLEPRAAKKDGRIVKISGRRGIANFAQNKAILSADSIYTDRESVRSRQLPDGGTTFVLQLHEDATDDKHQA